jgi:glycosyltransferase involved in cell wall biosynthesis
MSEKNIKVSIITPAYNRQNLLPRAIESVHGQSFGDWELIIVDDRSTDGTRGLVEDYQKKDERIRYLFNTHSKGPAGARNCGIESAQGEFIAFLDSDDEWSENYLKDSLTALQAEDVDICLSLFSQEKEGMIERRFEGIAAKIIRELLPFKKGEAFYFLNKNICEFMVVNWAFFTT